jgi:hypothetical protein
MYSPTFAIITIPDFYKREYKYGSLTLQKSVLNDYVETATKPKQIGLSAEAEKNYYEQQAQDRFLADLENTAQRYGVVYSLPKGYKGNLKIGYDVFLHQNAISNLIFYGHNKSNNGINIPVDFENIMAYGDGDKWVSHHNFLFLQPVSLESKLLSIHGNNYEKYRVLIDGQKYKKDQVIHILPIRIGLDVFFERQIFYGFDKFVIGIYDEGTETN